MINNKNKETFASEILLSQFSYNTPNNINKRTFSHSNTKKYIDDGRLHRLYLD